MRTHDHDEDDEEAGAARRAGLADGHGRPTPRYARYLRHARAHRDALTARDEAYERALRDPHALQQWPLTGRRLQDEVDEAWDRWVVLGAKAQVEAELAAARANHENHENHENHDTRGGHRA